MIPLPNHGPSAYRPPPTTGIRQVADSISRSPYEVLAAESAEAALDLLEDVPPPAALVSDVTMPGMDGLDLARRLRARWPDLPVVLLSGYAASALGQDLNGEIGRAS